MPYVAGVVGLGLSIGAPVLPVQLLAQKRDSGPGTLDARRLLADNEPGIPDVTFGIEGGSNETVVEGQTITCAA